MTKEKKESSGILDGFMQNTKDMFAEGSKPVNFFGLRNEEQQPKTNKESLAEFKLKKIREILEE